MSDSTNDPLVIFTPSGKRAHIAPGTKVLDAARQMGVDLDSVCGGRGICSKCQVTPSYGEFPKHGIHVAEDALSEWNRVEERYDRVRGLKDGRRLGCQAEILSDIVIDVPPESQVHRQVVRKEADKRTVHMDPATRLFYIEVEEPDLHTTTGDFQRVKEALHEQFQIEGVTAPLSILSRLQKVLRKGEWKITLALHKGHRDHEWKVIDIWPGLREENLWGLAIDLGSTTIAAHMVNLRDGTVEASAGIMNPQIRFGEDLMSRVSYSMMNPGGDQDMTRAVRKALNELVTNLGDQSGIDPTEIVEAVIVLNPVMHHLLLGIDPFELGQAPFAPATSEGVTVAMRDLDITTANPEGQVFILPIIAGHVGADSAAVALAEEPRKSDDLVLIVDVGTNAELLLGDRNQVLACSSPTGPALEGAQISSGQRAAPGAIERVEIDPVTKEPRFKVIGSDRWSDEAGFSLDITHTGITGICGSGIIEAVAEMRIAGIVDRHGLIGSKEQVGTERCVPQGRTHSYLLYDDSANDGPRILVTQADIRAIQLAKSALYAGAELLMEEKGVDHVDRVVLAGAFGAHISPKHAMILGMFPDVPLDKVRSAGNAAGTGARIALCSVAARAEIEHEVRAIIKVETAIAPNFQDFFVGANGIPHRTAPFENLAKIVTLPEPEFNVVTEEHSRRRRRRTPSPNAPADG